MTRKSENPVAQVRQRAELGEKPKTNIREHKKPDRQKKFAS